MNCLICAQPTNSKLCNKCSEIYLYDSTIKMVRKKKHSQSVQIIYSNELLLYKNLCTIYDKKNVYRNIHPLWAVGKKGVLLEYDVGVPAEHILFEYDGLQHFQYPNFFHKTKQDYLDQRFRDKLKTKLAKKNGFKLIRFSYKDQIDDINIKRKIEV